MPSTISFSASALTKTSSNSIYSRLQKKQRMSITKICFLSHSARGKLSKEAARPDHDLRLLVGHANMLDSLMLDLASAEQEQERWFNKTVSGAHETEEKSQSRMESIQEEDEMETGSMEFDSDVDEDVEDDPEFALTYTPSRHSPPALMADVDSDSDDESMPPSPPQPTLDTMSEKQRQVIATPSFYDTKNLTTSPVEREVPESQGYHLPPNGRPTIFAAS